MLERSSRQNENFKQCGDLSVGSGRASTQIGWYTFASEFCAGQTVLDVCSGLGEGIKVLSLSATDVMGLEVDRQLESNKVMIKELSEIDSDSFDTIVCIDVIEHIENDLRFVKDLMRVARRQVLVSTPNWTASRCHWPYHVREYTPVELVGLFKRYGDVDLFKGEPSGDRSFQVRFMRVFFVFNAMRNFPLTSFLTRCLNVVLPQSFKINSHLFIRIRKRIP